MRNCLILALVLPVAAFADPPPDTQLSLGEVGLPTWMPSYTGGKFVQPIAAYPISLFNLSTFQPSHSP